MSPGRSPQRFMGRAAQKPVSTITCPLMTQHGASLSPGGMSEPELTKRTLVPSSPIGISTFGCAAMVCSHCPFVKPDRRGSPVALRLLGGRLCGTLTRRGRAARLAPLRALTRDTCDG